MNYRTSTNVTRLIKRLYDAIELDALTLEQLQGLTNIFDQVNEHEPTVLRNVPGIDLFQQQLTKTQFNKHCVALGFEDGQLGTDLGEHSK